MVHHQNEISVSGQKTLPGYLIGFVLSLLLTFIAFGLIYFKLLNAKGLYLMLGVLAISQFLVQLMCFLRLNMGQEGRWNLIPFVFTVMIIFILVGGSLWIMFNLNDHMMI